MLLDGNTNTELATVNGNFSAETFSSDSIVRVTGKWHSVHGTHNSSVPGWHLAGHVFPAIHPSIHRRLVCFFISFTERSNFRPQSHAHLMMMVLFSTQFEGKANLFRQIQFVRDLLRVPRTTWHSGDRWQALSANRKQKCLFFKLASAVEWGEEM